MWEISEKASGSDHAMIQFSIYIDNGILVENPLYSNQYNFEKADWKKFENDLIFATNMDKFRTQLDDSIPSLNILENEAEKLRDIILKATKNISKRRVTKYSKC